MTNHNLFDPLFGKVQLTPQHKQLDYSNQSYEDDSPANTGKYRKNKITPQKRKQTNKNLPKNQKQKKIYKKQKKNKKVFFLFFFVFFLCFLVVFQNTPWTQDLTTVSQKKTKTKKKDFLIFFCYVFCFFWCSVF